MNKTFHQMDFNLSKNSSMYSSAQINNTRKLEHQRNKAQIKRIK